MARGRTALPRAWPEVGAKETPYSCLFLWTTDLDVGVLAPGRKFAVQV